MPGVEDETTLRSPFRPSAARTVSSQCIPAFRRRHSLGNDVPAKRERRAREKYGTPAVCLEWRTADHTAQRKPERLRRVSRI
jgi:hypothetical protein